jgi:ERCC4-type nuclease
MDYTERYVKTLRKLPGVDDAAARNLVKAGLRTVKHVDAASQDEVQAASGLSKAKAKAIKDHIAAMKSRRRGRKQS